MVFNAVGGSFVTREEIDSRFGRTAPCSDGEALTRRRRRYDHVERAGVRGDVLETGAACRRWVGLVAAIPGDRAVDHLGDAPGAPPAKLTRSFGTRQVEDIRLGWIVRSHLPCPAALTAFDEPLDDLRDSLTIRITRAEVPGSAEPHGVGFEQTTGQHKVTAQGFEDMLPRADCTWVSDRHPNAQLVAAHDVSHQPVGGPVAATNHIAGPCRGHCHTVPMELV